MQKLACSTATMLAAPAPSANDGRSHATTTAAPRHDASVPAIWAYFAVCESSSAKDTALVVNHKTSGTEAPGRREAQAASADQPRNKAEPSAATKITASPVGLRSSRRAKRYHTTNHENAARSTRRGKRRSESRLSTPANATALAMIQNSRSSAWIGGNGGRPLIAAA